MWNRKAQKVADVSKEKTRVLALADLHCGHRTGLTPPAYLSSPKLIGKEYHDRAKFCWKQFSKWVDGLRPIDRLIVNGDGIDGRGKKSAGQEQVTCDLNMQLDMFAWIIDWVGAEKTACTNGSTYHVEYDDWERVVERMAKKTHIEPIRPHIFPLINGVQFDVRHQAGGRSGVPATQGYPLSKDHINNILWKEYKGSQPKSDVILRGHVHYAHFTGKPGIWTGFMQPALQGSSLFGEKKGSWVVDWGLLYIDVYPNKRIDWEFMVIPIEGAESKILRW